MTIPKDIKLHKASSTLELIYESGESFKLSAELLRVLSPSAEVRGHSPSQAVLQWGKENVVINNIKPVGHYAVQLIFDDGHDTGIYSWDYLRDLCDNKKQYWDEYLEKLHAEGKSRSADVQVINLV